MVVTATDPLAGFDAVLADLDGVITKTAVVHAAAWKATFDAFLAERAEREGLPYEPFDVERDYRTYVDGKPRESGVRSFLESRGIDLPSGESTDRPDQATIAGLARRKNTAFQKQLAKGIDVYGDAVAFLRAARERGLRLAVVSSSKNCKAVLAAAGLTDLFDFRVDGNDLTRLGLPGKPSPALFLEAASRLGVPPERAVVLEDAVAGVEAGRRGGFGLVIGVDRGEHGEELKRHGAHVAVSDLSTVLTGGSSHLPSALASIDVIRTLLAGARPAVFLDYDGTLTPIVDRPELATLSTSMRTTVRSLARACTVAIISGRDRADVERLVAIDSLVYAGSHGFDIAGPGGLRLEHREGAVRAHDLEAAAAELRDRLERIAGAMVESKRFALAVHYRLVADADVSTVARVVDEVAERFPRLRKTGGKKIFELRPAIAWDKGKAVLWLLDALGLDRPDVVPLYLGDDVTDEDAFAVLEDHGVGIRVGDPAGTATHARYRLADTEEVEQFLQQLTGLARSLDRSLG